MLRRFILPGFLTLAFAIIAMPAQAATTGDLIKCPDFSSVYYLAEDGTRNVFPNEKVYDSWYEDFDDVKEISCDDMATLPVGELVSYQAGTRLIKTPFNPDVYAVESDGSLRSIQSEDQAKLLYGADWAGRVDDIPETFFTHYEDRGPLEDGEMPEGMIFVDDDGDLFRTLSDGTVVEIDDLLSEEKEEMFEKFARKLETVEEKLDEIYGLMIDIREMKDEMEALFNEIMPMMQTVSVEAGFAPPDISFEELFQHELDMQDRFDDFDNDGINDYWDDKYDYWEDHDVDDDWYDDNYEVWVDDGYHEYYNDYYEVFEGEKNFDEWSGEYETTWREFDYDPFIEEKWERYDEWSEFDDGWTDYKDDWSGWQESEMLWEDHGFEYEIPEDTFRWEPVEVGDFYYWFDDGFIAYSQEEAEDHCNIWGPGSGGGVAWQCEQILGGFFYGNDYKAPETYYTIDPGDGTGSGFPYAFQNGHLVASFIEAEQYCSTFQFGGNDAVVDECGKAFGIFYYSEPDDDVISYPDDTTTDNGTTTDDDHVELPGEPTEDEVYPTKEGYIYNPEDGIFYVDPNYTGPTGTYVDDDFDDVDPSGHDDDAPHDEDSPDDDRSEEFSDPYYDYTDPEPDYNYVDDEPTQPEGDPTHRPEVDDGHGD